MADTGTVEKPRIERLADAQKTAYLEAYMAQQLQQKQFRYEDDKKKTGENGCGDYVGSGSGAVGLKVPQPPHESTFTVPDDGLGYDDGVRVLRTLGSWTPAEYPTLAARPNAGMIFSDLPHAYDMGASQRKPAPNTAPPQNMAPINRNTPQPIQKKEPTPKASNSNGVSSSGNKAFTCTICGKSLARKDKLVIHTRIHTGEKPYICEVCDKAFARRDKLVIHMNKMKHRTPTNVAPLGKRSVEKAGSKKEEEEVAKPPPSLQAAAANWSCELCGQMMTTREEWMVHAKAHLEEKITGIGVISPNSYPGGQRPTPAPAYTPVPMAGYGSGPQASNYPATFLGDRQYCPVCRQTFPNKAEFMVHVRAHFDTSAGAAKHTDQHSLDGNGICS